MQAEISDNLGKIYHFLFLPRIINLWSDMMQAYWYQTTRHNCFKFPRHRLYTVTRPSIWEYSYFGIKLKRLFPVIETLVLSIVINILWMVFRYRRFSLLSNCPSRITGWWYANYSKHNESRTAIRRNEPECLTSLFEAHEFTQNKKAGPIN